MYNLRNALASLLGCGTNSYGISLSLAFFLLYTSGLLPPVTFPACSYLSYLVAWISCNDFFVTEANTKQKLLMDRGKPVMDVMFF